MTRSRKRNDRLANAAHRRRKYTVKDLFGFLLLALVHPNLARELVEGMVVD